MRVVLAVTMSMFFVSCASAKKELTPQDVVVGEILFSNQEKDKDCSVLVGNIITMMPTPQTFVLDQPYVCGIANCPVSLPELSGQGVCLALSVLKKK
jgi:hypothetical protein